MVLSLNLSIETPENVVLTHQLAGPTYRLAAYLIDLVLRVGVFLGLTTFIMVVGAMTLPGLAIGTTLLLLFLLEWGYTIGFEFFWQGRTPGKYICGLRAIHENGQPLSWWGATLRNLVRIGDMLPTMLLYGEEAGIFLILPIYGPALVAMLMSPKLQRLGDLAARTVVVHSRRARLPRDPVIYDKIPPLDPAEINAVVPRSETLALIDQFLGRRSVLTYERGHELAGNLAQALAQRLDYQGDSDAVRKYPMAFLARVYVTFTKDNEPEVDVRAEPTRRRRRVPAGASA
ncbi:MAG: RDD family protein [Planctomycetaceae bacterium]|nr:RDD family protein [Planctomycetaceae bacterium]